MSHLLALFIFLPGDLLTATAGDRVCLSKYFVWPSVADLVFIFHFTMV